MGMGSENLGHALTLGDKLSVAKIGLAKLKTIQKTLAESCKGKTEVFEFGIEPKVLADYTLDGNLGGLMQSCIWHALALKFEFKLKLLHTIDAYLSAVDTKNPVSTFLLARYLLELVATVSEIDFLLQDCFEIKFDDVNRAKSFLVVLYRARHSTSDEKFKETFVEAGVPNEFYRPIRIGGAFKRLVSREGFATAASLYGTLSNLCHHNGSGHKLLTESFRETKEIQTRGGKKLVLDKKASAVTICYPASLSASNAFTITARIVWWCAHSANALIGELSEAPFTDRELSKLTKGKVRNARQFYAASEIWPNRSALRNRAKIGRNEICPCGSGRKYKHCCSVQGA